MRVPYDQQVADKEERLKNLYLGGLPLKERENLANNFIFLPFLGMEEPYYYRNKVVSPYAPGKKLAPGAQVPGKGSPFAKGAFDKAGKNTRKGKNKHAEKPQREILTGMYAAGTHKLVPTDTCLIENQAAKKVTLAIRDIMKRFHMEPYNEDTGEGFVRHAVVRVGHTSGEVLVTLVTNTEEFPASKAFCRELVKRCPWITTVVQNINKRQTNVILGEQERRLYGPGFILDTLCGLSFRISSHSFYQVNAVQTEVLYRRAIELARLSGTETLIDAYCGTGTIGLVAAKNGAAQVIGVDSVASAIHDARENARHNGIENAQFVVADAGEFMRTLARESNQDPLRNNLVLFMDPPRAGASEEFLQAALQLKPQRIVYISCNPQTQVRDVAVLCAQGYRLTAVQGVDMFPHTAHIESIAALELVVPSGSAPKGSTTESTASENEVSESSVSERLASESTV